MVPVLPARSVRFNAIALMAVPDVTTPLSMLSIRNALRGSMARLASSPAISGLTSDSSLPLASVIREIIYGLIL
ncbi:hypothetical protein D3C81_2166440 [compost metagenome]